MRTVVLSGLVLAIFSVSLVLAADDPKRQNRPRSNWLLPKRRMPNMGPSMTTLLVRC